MLQNKFARSIQKIDLYYRIKIYSKFEFSDRNDLLSLQSVFTTNHGTDLDDFSHV